MWSSVSASDGQPARTTDFPAVPGLTEPSVALSSTQLLPPPSLPTARPTFRALLAPYPPALYDTQETRSPIPSPPSPQLRLPSELENQPCQPFAGGLDVTACQQDPPPELLGTQASVWSGQAPDAAHLAPAQHTGSTSSAVQQQVDADLHDLYRASQRDLDSMPSSQIILPSPFTQYPMGLLQDRITLDEHMNGLSKPFIYPSAHGLAWHQPLPAATGTMLPPLQQLEQNIRPALTPYALDHQPALARYESPPYTPTQLDRGSPTYLYSPSQPALSYSHLASLQSGYCSSHGSSPPTPITYPYPPAGSNTISPSTIAAWRAEQDRIHPTPMTGSVFASPERIDADGDHRSPAESDYPEGEGEDELSSIFTSPQSQCDPSLPPAEMVDNSTSFGHKEVLADTNGIRYTTDAEEKQTINVRRKCFNCAHTKPPSWRKSVLAPGMILCNKCGIYERTHRRARPRQGDDEKLRRQICQPLTIPMISAPLHVQQVQPTVRLSPDHRRSRASYPPTPLVPSSVPASICGKPELDTSSVSRLASYAYTPIPTPVSSSSSMNFAEIPIGPPFPTTPNDRRSMSQDPYWSIQQHRSYAVSQTPSPPAVPPPALADANVSQPRIATAPAYTGRSDPYGTAYATRLAARYHAYPGAYYTSPPHNGLQEYGGPVRGIGYSQDTSPMARAAASLPDATSSALDQEYSPLVKIETVLPDEIASGLRH